MHFLENAKKLAMYGVELHAAKVSVVHYHKTTANNPKVVGFQSNWVQIYSMVFYLEYCI